MNTRLLPVVLAIAMFQSLPAHADDGHQHDAGPSTAIGPALPRFAVASERFELVGVVDGRRLTVYLDRFEDNAPVPDASLELVVGGAKVALRQHAPGEFEGSLRAAPGPGVVAVTATVSVGNDKAVLSAELDIHEDARAAASPAHGWRAYAGWTAGLAAALALLGWAAWRGIAARRTRIGAAA